MTTTTPTASMSEDSEHITLDALRRWNAGLGLLHLAQALVVLALTNARSLPVTGAFGNGPPGQPRGPLELERLFSYRIGWAVAAFLLLSAGFHGLVASPWGFPRYGREIAASRNRFRWVEYSLSASVMIVLIAGTVGITDVAALLTLFGTNVAMTFFGWLMETTSRPGRHMSWTPFAFGCIVGIVPWIAIVIYLVGAGGNVPSFVYGIFVSLFIFFNCFALNQFLQYRARGRWADYRYGERVYMLLSLVAKSLLAWQVFANVLI